MKSLSERIQFLLNSKGYTAYAFCKETGFSESTMSRLLKGGQKPNESNIKALTQFFGVSRAWLLKGEGPMIFYRDSETVGQKVNIHPEDIKSTQSDEIVNKRIPYYEIPATMSPIAVYSDEKEIPVYYIEMPALKDCDFALPAWGDSMYPKIKNGQIIAVKELRDKSQIQWGEIYLIITDEIRAVKYLRRHQDESKVILASENREHFDDMVIDKDKILHLFIVKGQINIFVN
jgi:phage repressor protein C with HTH and peptisase S24 domain